MWLIWLIWQLVRVGIRVALIDMAGATAKAAFAFLVEKGIEPGFYFDFSRRRVTLDIFDVDEHDDRYYDRMEVIIEQFCRMAFRLIGLHEWGEQIRRKRIFESLCWMCGVKKNGKHFGMHMLPYVVNVGTDAWFNMFEHVADVLPKVNAYELLRISQLPPSQREREIESSRNLVSHMMSNAVRDCVTPGQSVDTCDLVRNVVLGNFEANPFLPRHSAKLLAGMLYILLTDACRHQPGRNVIILEEAQELIASNDIGYDLLTLRKHNCALIISTQKLSNLNTEA